jgi:hypothetical protein
LKDHNNFRELCGLEKSTDTKLYADVVLFRNGSQKELVLDTINADRIKMDTKEGLKTLLDKFNKTGNSDLEKSIINYQNNLSYGGTDLFTQSGGSYILNEEFLDNEYLRYLAVKKPGSNGPSLLVVKGKRLEGAELQRFKDSCKMVDDMTGCNLRFTGEDFTIQNSGSIGVSEYGILKTGADFDRAAINKSGDARVVRIMIDTAVPDPHFVVIK